MQVTKGVGALFIEKAGYQCVILFYCEVFLEVLLGIYCKRFCWILSFHYTTVALRVWGWQRQKCYSKCPNKTMNGIFQKNFQTFYFTPENSLSLNLPLSPCLFVFFIIVFLCCNFWLQPSILLIKTPLPIQSLKNTLLQLKMRICVEFFWNQKFVFFHKRNFNPKVINYF